MIDQWNLVGLYGDVATIIYRNNDNVLHVKINTGQPHVYFNNDTYITITVKDPTGKIIFEKTLIGDQRYDADSIDIPFVAGSQLIIMHREPGNRFVTSSPDLKVHNQKVFTYEVTKSGTIRLVGTNSKPVITVPNDNVMITVGENFDSRKGVTANNIDDGDLTSTIHVISNVDHQKPGNYHVTYSITDSDGMTTTKTVNVKILPKAVAIDHAPVITVSSSNIEIVEGEAFDPLVGVSAVDKEDGILPVQVIASNLNINDPGTYHVIYQATDQAGASVTKKITVVVPKRSITPDKTPSTSSEPEQPTVPDETPNVPSEPEQPVIPDETSQDISIESKPSRVPHQELNTSSKVG